MAIGQRKGTVTAAGGTELELWRTEVCGPACSIVLKLGYVLSEDGQRLAGSREQREHVIVETEIGLRINDLLIGSLLHFPALCLGTALLLSGRKVTCGCAHRGRKLRHLLLLPLLGLDVALH